MVPLFSATGRCLHILALLKGLSSETLMAWFVHRVIVTVHSTDKQGFLTEGKNQKF